jgi:hypothetical protein
MKNAMILAGVFVFIIILSIIDVFKQRKERVTYEERLKELRKEPEEKHSFKAFCDDPGKTIFIPENSFIVRKVKEITFKDYEELNEMLNSTNPEDDLILNILRLDETESGKKAVLLVTTYSKIGDFQK